MERQALAFLLGTGNGALMLYAFLLITGRFALWHGPERRDWNPSFWSTRAAEIIAKLAASSEYSLYMPRESTRNFLLVTKSSPERRLRRVLFFNRAQGRISGVIHFGADCEGPPRTVHGGCIAAAVDGALGTCAYRTAIVPCLTANLVINYHNKVPLGTTVRIECWHVSSDDIPVESAKELEGDDNDNENENENTISSSSSSDSDSSNANKTTKSKLSNMLTTFPFPAMFAKKLRFNFRMFSISDDTFVYSSGHALFINAVLPNGKSLLPPILRFRSSQL